MATERVKKLAIVVLLVLAGCRRQVIVQSPPANAPGGATPREAMEKFMAAGKAQNLQAMASVWGTPSGPASSTIARDELEKREIIFFCYLKHDSFRITGDSPVANSERLLTVESKYQDLTRSTNFYAVRGPNERWYINRFDMDPFQAFCMRR